MFCRFLPVFYHISVPIFSSVRLPISEKNIAMYIGMYTGRESDVYPEMENLDRLQFGKFSHFYAGGILGKLCPGSATGLPDTFSP